MHRLRFSLLIFHLAFFGTILGAGCGKASVTLAPVSGKVTVGDKPVTSGQVSLVAVDANTSTDLSAGTIDANGEYKIFTGGSAGAPLGKYRITVTPNMVPTAGDTKATPMPFDRKYGDAKATPLSFEVVTNPASGAYDLKLTTK
jgi:hypothetical protein